MFADDSIEEIDVERNSSDSEISSCSPKQPCIQEPEEPHISSGKESIVDKKSTREQGQIIVDYRVCTFACI